MSVREGGQVAPELARRLLQQLDGHSPDLRAAAMIDADGRQVAATDDADWVPGTAELWRATEREDEQPAHELHVATEDGEVFSVRGPRGVIVATSERFALASLMLCDLRAVLRALDGGG